MGKIIGADVLALICSAGFASGHVILHNGIQLAQCYAVICKQHEESIVGRIP